VLPPGAVDMGFEVGEEPVTGGDWIAALDCLIDFTVLLGDPVVGGKSDGRQLVWIDENVVAKMLFDYGKKLLMTSLSSD